MSWRGLSLGGFSASAIGAVLGAGVVSWFGPETGSLVSGATIGAIAGSTVGWHLFIRPGLRADPMPTDVG